MALTDTQFEALREQLRKKKATLGDADYQSFLQKTSSIGETEEGRGFIADVGVGVAKGVGRIGLGLGRLGRGIQRGVSKVTGLPLGEDSIFDPESESGRAAAETLESKTTAQKVGGFVTDVASFAIPGAGAVKATKGLSFLKRAATLGATDAVVTTVKQGEFDRESVDAAIIGAAFPVVGKGLSAAKRAVLPSGKDAGGKVINSLIKPLLKDFSYGKNPGNAVAEAGITANSLDELQIGINKVRQQVGVEIGEKTAQSTKRFNVEESFSALDTALVEAQKAPRTNAAVINRIQDLKDDLLRVGEDGVATRNLKDISADEVFELKREIGDLTRWTGNATDDEIVNKALKQTYGKLKSQLDDAIPGLSEKTERYANLRSAEIATEYRDKIAARQNLVSFTGLQAGTAAAVTTAIVSGGALAPILIGTSAAALATAAKSPAVKTRLAAWLASAPKKEVQDAFTQAPFLRGTLQTILFDVSEEN